ncbi:ferrous iron transporter B [Rhodopseudomonas palustris]|uniref:Ferrous iron transport protein B n=2 Tax=Rhodopseudomonas palustris TaxID=1076 RepID=A0A323UHK7_RHOPL|nr:ferrous iron transporter B [Rhodopseudomonas palustris]
MHHHTIAVVGNPNCGKTTLFNLLTGAAQKVGNWPGVTVEKKVGSYSFARQRYGLVDLPGIYMLGSVGRGGEDEKVARDYILAGEADVVVDVIDAANLERNLYLTVQLCELGVPLVVVLNMIDLAERAGSAIDTTALANILGCPVVPVVASRGTGADDLRRAIAAAVAAPTAPKLRPTQAGAVAAAVGKLAPELSAQASETRLGAEWLALKLIEGDDRVERMVGSRLDPAIEAARAAIAEQEGDDADIIIADGRYRTIGEIMAGVHHRSRRLSASVTQAIDRVVLNRFLGVPIFLLVMYLMFLFTISIGGAFVDFFDQAVAAIAVDWVGEQLAPLGAPGWVLAIVKGLGSGIQTLSTFIPIIASLFLFLSFLEDSGYMARAAFVMDRAMRTIGLPGKSFVPLIVGFGCNVPAIMATRTLESHRDRILTALMAPFISCGARLPVFALFAAAFFPSSGQNVVFALYLAGILFAVVTGLVLKATLLPGGATPFVMELPVYHLPTVRTVLIQAWRRLSDFIFRAGQVIVPIVTALSFLAAIGTDGSIGKENSKDSVLATMSRQLVPIFEPMGVRQDNWPAAVGLFTGIFAKEAVVGTLNALYEKLGESGTATAAAAAPDQPGLAGKLLAAVQTIPAKFAALGDALLDPFGIDVRYVSDDALAAEKLKVAGNTFGAMRASFDGAIGAFAYMLLILLYTPCVAALGAIRHEVGLGWTVFSALWNTTLGWLVAVAFYQAAMFARDPAIATSWLIVVATALAAMIGTMWAMGRWQAWRLAPPMSE